MNQKKQIKQIMEKIGKTRKKVEDVLKCGKLGNISIWLLASEVCTILNALYEVDAVRKIGRGEDVS